MRLALSIAVPPSYARDALESSRWTTARPSGRLMLVRDSNHSAATLASLPVQIGHSNCAGSGLRQVRQDSHLRVAISCRRVESEDDSAYLHRLACRVRDRDRLFRRGGRPCRSSGQPPICHCWRRARESPGWASAPVRARPRRGSCPSRASGPDPRRPGSVRAVGRRRFREGRPGDALWRQDGSRRWCARDSSLRVGATGRPSRQRPARGVPPCAGPGRTTRRSHIGARGDALCSRAPPLPGCVARAERRAWPDWERSLRDRVVSSRYLPTVSPSATYRPN